MHNKILISIALATTLFIGCGGGTSSSTSEPMLTINTSGNILIVQNMKKSVKLNIDKKDVRFEIVNKPKGISVELQSFGGILTYWAEDPVGSVHKISVRAVDDKGWESKPLTLPFEIVSKNISPTIEVLSTGVDGDIGKARNFTSFTKNSKEFVIDPFENIWDKKLDAKDLESKLYIYAKNRCEILRLTNKDTFWRVPTVDELLNLVDYSKVSGESMLDEVFDKSTLSTWANSDDDRYFVVSASAGIVNEVEYLDKYPIRCINAPIKSTQHVVSTETGLNGSTFDFSTGLKWSPMTKDSFRKILDDVNQSAAEYCTSYDGASGWRLPNINEVRSLVVNDTISSDILKGNNVIFSSTPLKVKDVNARKAFYYLGLELGKAIISVSPDTNISYPITCVKEI